MKSLKQDPLTAERLRMETLGKIFLFFFFALLIYAGHWLLS